jgi:hypothetical protein
MLHEYQVFITNLVVREKAPLFDDLTGIFMQEEEKRKTLNNKFQNSYQYLMAKGKKPYKGKPWVKNKGGKLDVKLYQSGFS